MFDWTAFPVGTRVRCREPEDFMAEVRNKLRNREGTVVRHQMFSNAPIIDFPAVGRRKAFKWVPPRPQDLEIIHG